MSKTPARRLAQRRRRSGGRIGARDIGDPSFARCAAPLAGGENVRQRAEEVLDVPGIAQDRVRHAAFRQRLLRLVVIGGEGDQRAGLGLRHRGVDDMADASARRRRRSPPRAGAGAGRARRARRSRRSAAGRRRETPRRATRDRRSRRAGSRPPWRRDRRAWRGCARRRSLCRPYRRAGVRPPAGRDGRRRR